MLADEKESFVLRAYATFLGLLHYTSLTYLVNKSYFEPKKKDDKVFIEGYVVFNTMLSFLTFFFWFQIDYRVSEFLFYWGVYRTYEILTVQVNALLFDFYRKTRQGLQLPNKGKTKPYAIQGYTRITLLLLHNYAEITLWFSVFYLHYSPYFVNSIGSLFGRLTALSLSFYTMTTFGHLTNVTLSYPCGYELTLIQAAIGLFMALLILARFIGLLPKAPSSDKVEIEMESRR